MEKTRNTSIDAMRFVCAFFVVCQHVQFYPAGLSQYISAFVRMAVPFFFLISGYHLYENCNITFKNKIASAIKKTAKITALYSVLYILWWRFRSIFPNVFPENNFDFFGFIFFNGGVEHLWYLYAFLYTLIVLYIVGIKIINKYVIIFLFIIYVTASLYARSMPLKEYSSWMDLNWITMGLQYVVMGAAIKKYSQFFFVNKAYLLKIIIVSFLGLYVEHFLLKKYIGRGPSVISIFVFSIAIFVYCLKERNIFSEHIQNKLEKIGKITSLDVYIHHIWVRDIMYIMNLKSATSSWLIFSVVCFGSYFIRVANAKRSK